MAIAGSLGTSAHRRDEYLQAARVAIDPGGAQIELDLTPGIALADAIIADIDRDGDGALSAAEQHQYAGVILGALEVELDGTPLRLQPGAASFPDTDAMRRGEGAIRLQSTVTLPRLSPGAHHLLFRNRHHPDRSVYLANALVPQSYRLAVTGQRRDDTQRELTIDYVLREAPATSTGVWLLGSLAAAAGLTGFAVFGQRFLPHDARRSA